MVAGYAAWQAMGRQVGKGEPGIRIIAERDGDAAPDLAALGPGCDSPRSR